MRDSYKMSKHEWIIHWGHPLASGVYDHHLDPLIYQQLMSQYPFQKNNLHLYHLDGLTYQITEDQTICCSQIVDQINTVPIPVALSYHRRTIQHSFPFQPINQYQTENMTNYTHMISHDLCLKLMSDEDFSLQLICQEPLFIQLLSLDWQFLKNIPTIPDQLAAVIQHLTKGGTL